MRTRLHLLECVDEAAQLPIAAGGRATRVALAPLAAQSQQEESVARIRALFPDQKTGAGDRDRTDSRVTQLIRKKARTRE